MIERTTETIRPVDLLRVLKRVKPLDTPTITPEDLSEASQPVTWASEGEVQRIIAAVNAMAGIKRRTLATILKVPEDTITTTDPGKHVWKCEATEYAVWPEPVRSPNLVLVGTKDGLHIYRCR